MRRTTRICLAALIPAVVAASAIAISSAAGTDEGTEARDGEATIRSVPVRGTRLMTEIRGTGEPLLLIHGGGEDRTMLAAQASDLARAGYRVISYDRRGTGGSGRDDRPGGGADPHADDAAGLLAALGVRRATVVGVSSGGVVALAMAARHPDRVHRAVAWEPPAVGVLPGAEELTAAIMRPVLEHLETRPKDFVGAQAILLSAIVGRPVSRTDPAFAAARRNAEPMIRDEPSITLRPFTAAELRGRKVTLAAGDAPQEPVASVVAALGRLTGRDPVVVPGAEHEVYLASPAVLTRVVRDAARRSG